MKLSRLFLLFILFFATLTLFGCKGEGGSIKVVGGGGIVMFSSDASINGALGASRAEVDNYCIYSSKRPTGYSTVHTFISYSDPDDEIRDMPANYGVPQNTEIRSPNGSLIFTDWEDLIDNSGLSDTLANFGVLPGGQLWWSGSDSPGNINGNHCTNWSDGTSGSNGTVGSSDYMINDWINTSAPTCDNSAYLLCLAY